MRVLLAVGDDTIASTLRHHLTNKNIEVDNNEVLHRSYLEEYVELYQPEMLIVHDSYLPSDAEGETQVDAEMLLLLETFRMTYGRALRIVYLCIRSKKDPFLAQLVARDVLDIFNEMQIDLPTFVNQLESEPTYSNVSKFANGGMLIPLQPEVSIEDDDEFFEEEIEKPEEKGEGNSEKGAASQNWMKSVRKTITDIELPKVALPKLKKPNSNKNMDLKEMDIQQEPLKSTEELLKAEPMNKKESPVNETNEAATEGPVEIVERTFNESSDETRTSRRKTNRIIPEPRVKEVIRYMSIPFQIILVGGLYSGAGTTTFASNLAIQLAKRDLKVGYLEYPLIDNPYIFDYLQIHALDTNEDYLDLGNELAHKTITMRGDRQFWTERGVTWSVNDTRKVPGLDYKFEDMMLHAQGLKTNFLVVDIGTRWEDAAIQRFLSIAEHILIVTDTDPIKLDKIHAGGDRYSTSEKKILSSLEKSNRSYKIIQMRAHEEMDKSIMKHLQFKTPSAVITDIPFSDMQKALYKKQFIYETSAYQEQWEKDTLPLIRELLPKEMWTLTKKRSFLRFLKS